MSRRMMCTLCFETAEPETLLEGSDLTEIFSWLCFAVPGWLYCLWRHSLRSKICASCGGESLIREARAAQRFAAPPSNRPRIRSASGPALWPRAFANPRDRLLHGGIAAVLVGSLPLVPIPALLIALSTGWLLFEIRRVLRMKAPACSAWDDSGRAMRIELV